MQNVEARIVRIKNEIKALKVARELIYSKMLWPENTPNASWSGDVDISTWAGNNVLARFRVRFSRTDGKSESPVVDFPFNLTFSPTYVEYMRRFNITVSGNDTGFVDEQGFTGYTVEAKDGHVDFYIDISDDVPKNFGALTSINVTIEAQAASMNEGTLTIERVI